MNKALILAAVVLSAGTALADLSGQADAHVYVDVVSNLSLCTVTISVDMGQVQTGIVEGQIIYCVHANVECIEFSVMATHLFKARDPFSAYRIPVKTGAVGDGALVQPQLGNAVMGHGNLLAWLPGDCFVNAFPGVASEAWCFESAQAGRFSQDVVVGVRYSQDDPGLPKGEYSGWVKLVATVLP